MVYNDKTLPVSVTSDWGTCGIISSDMLEKAFYSTSSVTTSTTSSSSSAVYKPDR